MDTITGRAPPSKSLSQHPIKIHFPVTCGPTPPPSTSTQHQHQHPAPSHSTQPQHPHTAHSHSTQITDTAAHSTSTSTQHPAPNTYTTHSVSRSFYFSSFLSVADHHAPACMPPPTTHHNHPTLTPTTACRYPYRVSRPSVRRP